MSQPTPAQGSAQKSENGITEVRYSLPEMLREVQLERSASIYAMEKLDRAEIAKLFQKNRPRRAFKNVK